MEGDIISTEYCANCKKSVVLEEQQFIDCTFWRCPECRTVLDQDFDYDYDGLDEST